jgi:hypothetical protein
VNKTLLLQTVMELIQGELVTCPGELSREIQTVHASDLISEVLASCDRGALWITGLLDRQIINTAELFDLSGVVFVSNRRPSPEIIQAAVDDQIPILITKLTMFETCGILYHHGLLPGKR